MSGPFRSSSYTDNVGDFSREFLYALVLNKDRKYVQTIRKWFVAETGFISLL